MRQGIMKAGLVALFSLWGIGISVADTVKIQAVDVTRLSSDYYQISVTLKHDDTGWDHFADRWEVLTEEGKILGTRTLLHPHVNEQPFTRSLSLSIPQSVNTVVIRAHDKVHGYGENSQPILLNK